MGSCHELNHTFDVSGSISMTDRYTHILGKIDRWDNSMHMGALPVLPALGGLCVTPGDMLFLCRPWCASGNRLWLPRDPPGWL